jgi:hypothetical protein
MDEPEKQPDEERPIRSRRALAGESVVTDTAVGDERIFGFQPRDQPRPDEQAEQVDEEPVEQVSDSSDATQPWLPPPALPRDPQPTFPDGHWAHWTDWL